MAAADGTPTISIEREGSTCRLAVTGEVGDAAGRALTDAAARVHPAHDRVVIDLTAVSFIDIYGFDHVLVTRDALARTGCRVEVETAGMTELMLEVLQLSS